MRERFRTVQLVGSRRRSKSKKKEKQWARASAPPRMRKMEAQPGADVQTKRKGEGPTLRRGKRTHTTAEKRG